MLLMNFQIEGLEDERLNQNTVLAFKEIQKKIDDSDFDFVILNVDGEKLLVQKTTNAGYIVLQADDDRGFYYIGAFTNFTDFKHEFEYHIEVNEVIECDFSVTYNLLDIFRKL